MWKKFDIAVAMHKKFVKQRQTVNGKFSCDVPRRLRENIRHKLPDKWRNKSWTLKHDNAPAHLSFIVRTFLDSKNMTVIPHPPYSPDFASCEFFFQIPENEIESQGAPFWQH
jgi:uncharacterized protein YukJ